MFRVKICGITNPLDAREAAAAGADAIGVNFYRGSKRFVPPETAKTIVEGLPSGVAVVGVFVNSPANDILELVKSIPLDYVQLHGDEPPEFLQQLSQEKIIKAFRCRDAGLAAVADYMEACAALGCSPTAVLIDAYEHGEYGGTGRALDWTAIGRDVSIDRNIPLILAGGLCADNVARAIALARPFAVDVASSVETSPGVKDAEKVRAFVENARRAFNA